MHEECLICGAPLLYLKEDKEMSCALCGKKEKSKTLCAKGHYVCSACHMQGLDSIISLCLSEESKSPVHILEKMMSLPFCHMHGPEHHIMVGAALLTAYQNAGGQLNLAASLSELFSRARQVPGGACGFWGACGAGISSGMFISIVTGATPLAEKPWGLANQMTAASLAAIGQTGGPRCCKRNSYTAIREAVKFVKEHLGIEMAWQDVRCTRSEMNNQCLGSRCPFQSNQ